MKKNINLVKLINGLALVVGAGISIISSLTSDKLMNEQIQEEVKKAVENLTKEK